MTAVTRPALRYQAEVEIDPHEQFLALARELGAQRRYAQDQSLFDRLMRDIERMPPMSAADHDRLVDVAKKASGVA